MALNYTSVGNASASSFADLVVLSSDSSLYSQLEAYWGNQTFTGEFLLEKYGELSVSEKNDHFLYLPCYDFCSPMLTLGYFCVGTKAH